MFVNGDVPRPLAIRYQLDPNRDGRPLRFHRLPAGPLSATPASGSLPTLDPTLQPELLYWDSQAGLMNFGYARLEIDGQAYRSSA